MMVKDKGRITPAHAGKTAAPARRALRSPDHPRACGENRDEGYHAWQNGGSPPRMRGKRSPRCRIIHPVLDHPRACGENCIISTLSSDLSGSPPRMRGKPSPCLLKRPTCRITPAHAGKTVCKRQFGSGNSDHPRACGENTSEMAYFRG